MTDAILEFFSELGGSQIILITLLVAMIPVIELKGAIPFGASTKFWGDASLSVWGSFGVSFLGSTIISILLILLYKKILALLMRIEFTKNLAHKIKNKLNRHKADIDSQVDKSKGKSKRLAKAIAIGSFVAVPLPLTGVWTGACLCTVLGMPIIDSILSIIIGNLICGLIVTLVSKQFEAYTHIILLVVLALALVLFVGKIIISKIRHRHTTTTMDSVESTPTAPTVEEK